MNQEITAMNKQSWLDISMQYLGGVKNAQKLAFFNESSLTDEITPGQKIIIPQMLIEDTEIMEYFKTNNIQIASDLNESETGLIPSVIPFAIINQATVQ